uniref:Uncharacterized protein n=1 Tax=Brassica campestris TaxID=3711 RepID=M4ENV1_BRACM
MTLESRNNPSQSQACSTGGQPSRHPLRYDHFLKSNGISAVDFPRLIFLCPQLFSATFSISQTNPVFDEIKKEKKVKM